MSVREQTKPLTKLSWVLAPSPERSRALWLIDRSLLTDVRQLRRVLHRHGCTATYVDIHDAWEEYSQDDMSAGWLSVNYSDEQIMKGLLKYLTQDDKPRREGESS